MDMSRRLAMTQKSPGVRMPTDVDGSPASSTTNYFAAYYYYPRKAASAVFAWRELVRWSELFSGPLRPAPHRRIGPLIGSRVFCGAAYKENNYENRKQC